MATNDEAPESGSSSAEVTELLRAWRAGDARAEERLIAVLYRELHDMAQRRLRRERQATTLQTTALVHEAYLRLVDQQRVEWRDRGHFLALAATMMRRVLVDRARARRASKRGAGEAAVALTDVEEMGVDPGVEVLDVDWALERLAAAFPRPARVVTAIERVQAARRLLEESRQGSALLDLRVALDLAESYRAAGRLREANTAFAQASARLTAMGRGETERASTLLNNWALVMRALGHPLAAERLFRRAIQISSADGSEENVSPMVLSNFARTLMDLDRLPEARDYADRVYVEARRAGDEEVITHSLFLRNLIYLRLGDLPRAASILAELEPRVMRHPPGHYFYSVLASQQGLLVQARGDADAARAAHDRAIALADPQDLPILLLRRSDFELESQRLDAARADAARALALAQRDAEPGTFSSRIGQAHLALGRALLAQGKRMEARVTFARALEQLAPTLGASHPDSRAARELALEAGRPRADKEI